MKTIIFAVAALIVAASSTSSVEAKGSFGGGRSMGSHSGNFRSHSGMHGHYRGHHSYHHNYRGWSQRRWFSNYGCYGYYCPTRCCWYYQYQTGNCYLPMTCAQTYAPASFPNSAPYSPNSAPNQAPVEPVKPITPVKPVKPVKPV